MSENWASLIGITSVGVKAMIGVITGVWGYCRLDATRMAKLAVMCVALTGVVTFGSMSIMTAQEHETVKDMHQDDRMDYQQKIIEGIQQNRIETRAETLQHRNLQDAEISENSSRTYAISERVGRLEEASSRVQWLGGGMFTVILGLLGFIFKREWSQQTPRRR